MAGAVGLVFLGLVVGGVFWLRARAEAEAAARVPIDRAEGNAMMCDTLLAHENMVDAWEWVTAYETRAFRCDRERPISHEDSVAVIEAVLEAGAPETWIRVPATELTAPLVTEDMANASAHWSDTLVVALPEEPEARRAIFALHAERFDPPIVDVGQSRLLFDFRGGGYRSE